MGESMAKGIGGMGNMGNLLKQAQEMQSKLAQVQEEMAQKTVEATSGGGMVKVTVNGQMALIDPTVVNPQEIEMLEDLIQAAINEGIRRAREMVSEEMSKLTGGFKIPGMMV
jgi:DNA-binding YbaB/EbfC family protein